MKTVSSLGPIALRRSLSCSPPSRSSAVPAVVASI